MRNNHRLLTYLTAVAVGAAPLLVPLSASAQQQFPVTSLHVGKLTIKAEVASSEAQREQGLMFREQLGQDAGMVFVYGPPEKICMWMKNTLIPLSVAFMDKSGAIINIEDMKAQTLDPHCASAPATYSLEMNKDWFAQNKIELGAVIEGLPN